MTPEQLRARRRAIVKRNAARKISETWKRKKRGRPAAADPMVLDDDAGVPESDAILDELPDSLLG